MRIDILAAVLIAATVFAYSTTRAQGCTADSEDEACEQPSEDHDPLPGLDDDSNWVFNVDVDVRLNRLTEYADHVVIHCWLGSRVTDEKVADGDILLTRDRSDWERLESERSRPFEVGRVLHFTGTSFERTVPVPMSSLRRSHVRPGGAGDMPDEWTDGFCGMTVWSSAEFGGGGPPMNCMQGRSASEEGVSYDMSICAWPGTNIDDAKLEFTREGLDPLPDDHIFRSL